MQTAGVDLAAFQEVYGCPFQGPFYQLMRQTLVAGYLRLQGVVAQVVSVSFSGNAGLHAVPGMLRSLGQGDIITAWNRVLHRDAPALLHLPVEQLVVAVDRASEMDEAWRGYIRDRYGV
jgi:hypothetical protein